MIGRNSLGRQRRQYSSRDESVAHPQWASLWRAATPGFVDGRLIMESEAIENIPAGFRARETYVFNGADAFEEIFEIAEPNADFQRYSHNRFTRA